MILRVGRVDGERRYVGSIDPSLTRIGPKSRDRVVRVLLYSVRKLDGQPVAVNHREDAHTRIAGLAQDRLDRARGVHFAASEGRDPYHDHIPVVGSLLLSLHDEDLSTDLSIPGMDDAKRP